MITTGSYIGFLAHIARRSPATVYGYFTGSYIKARCFAKKIDKGIAVYIISYGYYLIGAHPSVYNGFLIIGEFIIHHCRIRSNVGKIGFDNRRSAKWRSAPTIESSAACSCKPPYILIAKWLCNLHLNKILPTAQPHPSFYNSEHRSIVKKGVFNT